MQKKEVNIYDLFWGDGKLKRATKLSEFFTRPAYQYTSQEIRNTQRDKWIEESEKYLEDEQINY